VLFAVQTWPDKHLFGSVTRSQVGLTQWNLMLADASPVRAAKDKRAVLIFDVRIYKTSKLMNPSLSRYQDTKFKKIKVDACG
jgi:hypothetical protein